MSPEDQAIQAETLSIGTLHGPNAVRWVAERTVACNLAGDDAGVRHYRRIAARLDELLATRQPS